MLFFEQAVLEGQVGHALLQRTGLTTQILDLVSSGGTGRFASQTARSGLRELLRPYVVQARGYAFLAAQGPSTDDSSS